MRLPSTPDTPDRPNIDDLVDVTITSPNSGEILRYNGSVWENDTETTPATPDLDDLGDVTITTPSADEILRYSGSAWINDSLFPIVEPIDVSTFYNSWANFGSGFEGARYWKDNEGIVHLEGLIGGGNSPTLIFILPSGYRPQADLLFGSRGYHTSYGEGSIRIDIVSSSGNVAMIGPGYASAWGWISLNGITFYAG